MRRGFARVPAITAVAIAIAHQFVSAPQAAPGAERLRAEWARGAGVAAVHAQVLIDVGAGDGTTVRPERLAAQPAAVPCAAALTVPAGPSMHDPAAIAPNTHGGGQRAVLIALTAVRATPGDPVCANSASMSK